jgi:3-dehydroquinate synthase
MLKIDLGLGERDYIEVGLGERAYPVMVGTGLIAQAGKLCAPLLTRGRTAVVTDETVAALHGKSLTKSLAAAGIDAPMIVVPPGEQTKSFEGLADLSDRLLALGLDRGDLIVAFGGGVVGDLAGFAAAIYKRGIDFIQIPTTLLAQVDSSVGGKTAIDTARGKNLIGAFHQPRLVLADLDVLATLPDRQMRAGYAEVIKYGLLGDVDFFEWLEANGAAVLAREPEALARAVARSVQMKADIVTDDERETSGRRALLNLGHTFGHAMEAETGFGEALLHGEAVALGCAMALRFSAQLGLCPGQDAARAEAAIAAAGLPARLSDIPGRFPADRLVEHMGQDKKAEAGRLTFVLVHELGKAFTAKDVDPVAVRDFLIAEGALP